MLRYLQLFELVQLNSETNQISDLTASSQCDMGSGVTISYYELPTELTTVPGVVAEKPEANFRINAEEAEAVGANVTTVTFEHPERCIATNGAMAERRRGPVL